MPAGVLLALLAGLSLGISPAQATVFGSNGKIFCAGSRPVGALPLPSGQTRQEIFSVNPDGTNETVLTNNVVADQRPTVSPDGKTVAFESFRSGFSEIWTMAADGTGPATRLTFTNNPENRARSWSPDGTKIAFHSNRSGPFDIYTMNADGTNVTRLTNDAPQDTFPTWSPDGNRISFTSNREGGDFEIWTMNAADGTGLFRVTNSPGQDAWSGWSPDGKQLTFQSSRNGSADVFTTNADGTGTSTRLTFTPQSESKPTWSPDGSRIAYEGTDPITGDTSIYTISAVDGSDQTRLTIGTFDAGCDWQRLPFAAPTQPLPTVATPVSPTPGIAPDTLAPTAAGLGVSSRSFAVSGASTDKLGVAARRKRKQGTTFKYTLSEKATVKISIAERRGGKLTVRGTLTRASHQGANAVFFSGRIGSKALKPGSYQATLTATDAAKNVSQAKSVSFKIVKG